MPTFFQTSEGCQLLTFISLLFLIFFIAFFSNKYQAMDMFVDPMVHTMNRGVDTKISGDNYDGDVGAERVLAVPPYHAHRGYLRSLWMVPVILFGIYGLTLVGRFLCTILYHGIQTTKATIKEKVREATSRMAGGREREEFMQPQSSGYSSPTSVMGTPAEIEPITEHEERVRTEGGFAGEERDFEEPETEKSLWLRRFDRASQAARNAFLLSLLIATLGSLPIEYACRQPVGNPPGVPGEPIPLPPCGTCLGNAANLPLTIMSWVFLALSVVWTLLELFTTHAFSASGTNLVMTLIAQPLALVAFILFMKRWNHLRGHTCD